MKFTGNFEKMGKIMYRRIFVHYINFYRLENNMKLVSWNVNGIRACITKGFEESFAKLEQTFSVFRRPNVRRTR